MHGFGMAEEREFVFIMRCALGEQGSKKAGILAKKSTEEDARAAVAWHQQASPYRELSKEEALRQATSVDVEVAEEEKAAVEESKKDEGQGLFANRTRKGSNTEVVRV